MLCHAVTLTFDTLTLNVLCSCRLSVLNLSEIEHKRRWGYSDSIFWAGGGVGHLVFNWKWILRIPPLPQTHSASMHYISAKSYIPRLSYWWRNQYSI